MTGTESNLLTALRQLVTGIDGQTHDLGRWSWVICTASVLTHNFYQLLNATQANPAPKVTDLATALSAVALAHGIAIGAKKSTEPQS